MSFAHAAVAMGLSAAVALSGVGLPQQADLRVRDLSSNGEPLYLSPGVSGTRLLEVTAPDAAWEFPFEMIIDLSRLDGRISVVTESTQATCAENGSQRVCRGWLGSGGMTVGLRMTVSADASPGPAGTIGYRVRPTSGEVTDPNSGNDSGSLELDVMRRELGADMELTTPDVTGRVGQTVTASIKVHNKGPNTQMSYTLRSPHIADPAIQIVSGKPCSGSSSSIRCAMKAIRPGETRTVTIDFKLTGCPPAGKSFVVFAMEWVMEDPNQQNSDPRVDLHATGCTNAPVPEAAVNAVTPSPTGQAEPSPTGQAEPSPTPSTSIQPIASSRPAFAVAGWVIALAGLLVVAAAIAGWAIWRYRRHHPTRDL
ncbi:hypothetical protein Rhe02_27610 [Rhizocola hellebori]|uniref:DUF11 domain-containing protein n=1 Tax=Rhizocola hellebori TaxID=1392758 RepID=A0A8J3Q689_9ACTN|nr:DUF11 domain-containing protein [Rhizocola hellebori]GIH04694.1 hypothetical protein Rhe02_27610 [Rhizocola hellebori]